MNYKVGGLAALILNKELSNSDEKSLKIFELQSENANSSSSKYLKKEYNISNKIKNYDTKYKLKRKQFDESNKKDIPNKRINKNKKLKLNEHKSSFNNKMDTSVKIQDKSKNIKSSEVLSNTDNNEILKSNKIASKRDTDSINENDSNNVGERTIFVGNWPIKKSKKTLKNLFSKYGDIESIRFRSIPIAKSNIPKKVLAIKKQFHPSRTSMNAYVKFSDKSSAYKALETNGSIIDEHHLRVTLSTSTSNHDQKKSIFIGNIDFQAEEEDIWKIFSKCGEIESVRLVRDNKTGVSRGIGYVNFKKMDSVELALKLTNTDINGRILRIKRIHKNAVKQKNKQTAQKTNVSTTKKLKKNDFQGTKFAQKKDKKKKKQRIKETNKISKKNVKINN